MLILLYALQFNLYSICILSSTLLTEFSYNMQIKRVKETVAEEHFRQQTKKSYKQQSEGGDITKEGKSLYINVNTNYKIKLKIETYNIYIN